MAPRSTRSRVSTPAEAASPVAANTGKKRRASSKSVESSKKARSSSSVRGAASTSSVVGSSDAAVQAPRKRAAARAPSPTLASPPKKQRRAASTSRAKKTDDAPAPKRGKAATTKPKRVSKQVQEPIAEAEEEEVREEAAKIAVSTPAKPSRSSISPSSWPLLSPGSNLSPSALVSSVPSLPSRCAYPATPVTRSSQPSSLNNVKTPSTVPFSPYQPTQTPISKKVKPTLQQLEHENKNSKSQPSNQPSWSVSASSDAWLSWQSSARSTAAFFALSLLLLAIAQSCLLIDTNLQAGFFYNNQLAWLFNRVDDVTSAINVFVRVNLGPLDDSFFKFYIPSISGANNDGPLTLISWLYRIYSSVLAPLVAYVLVAAACFLRYGAPCKSSCDIKTEQKSYARDVMFTLFATTIGLHLAILSYLGQLQLVNIAAPLPVILFSWFVSDLLFFSCSSSCYRFVLNVLVVLSALSLLAASKQSRVLKELLPSEVLAVMPIVQLPNIRAAATFIYVAPAATIIAAQTIKSITNVFDLPFKSYLNQSVLYLYVASLLILCTVRRDVVVAQPDRLNPADSLGPLLEQLQWLWLAALATLLYAAVTDSIAPRTHKQKAHKE